MAIHVIGAGFGRTGTLSLKSALEMLGLGRCYHMVEVFRAPGHSQAWAAAGSDPHFDWETLLGAYGATVDWPSTAYWKRLIAFYPQAKVILTVRSPESWYKSCASTIFQAFKTPPPEDEPEAVAQHAMALQLIVDETFGGRIDDADHCMAVYERHNEEVRRTVPPERLLVIEPGQGWEPICQFLGLRTPKAPYPRINSTNEFRAKLGLDPV